MNVMNVKGHYGEFTFLSKRHIKPQRFYGGRDIFNRGNIGHKPANSGQFLFLIF